MTREDLIAICERATNVPWTEWGNRDSPGATMKLGECWALLKAGCPFEIRYGNTHEAPCITNEKTIWIDVHFTDFTGFEYGERLNAEETFYLPTPKRLDEVAGGDWY